MTVWTITGTPGRQAPLYERDGRPVAGRELRDFLDDTLPLCRSHPDRTSTDSPSRRLAQQVTITVTEDGVSASPPLAIGQLRMIRIWAEYSAICDETKAARRSRWSRLSRTA